VHGTEAGPSRRVREDGEGAFGNERVRQQRASGRRVHRGHEKLR